MKKVILMSMATVAAGFSFNAYAGDFTITNNTDKPVTSIINDGDCSTRLGPVGTTQPHSTTNPPIPEWVVKFACRANATNCKIAVHMNDNCSGMNKGAAVANVYLDTVNGIQRVDNLTSQYIVSGKGFNAWVDQQS